MSASEFKALKRLVDFVGFESTQLGANVVLRKRILKFVSLTQIAQWQQSIQDLAPNTVLQELQDQNRELVSALDQVQKVQAELEERTKQLQQANELKAQFLTSVSHEIRTPMGAIIGLASILKKRSKDLEDQRLLELLNESASALLTMINDLLDISKIDEGKLAIESHEFSMAELLRSAVAVFANEAERKAIRLSFVCTDDIPTRLIGDTNRIRQILINLIGNALKFSDCGTIEVAASLSWYREERVGVSVAVSDQGVGIADDDIKLLFEPFSQLADASARRVGGTGLGLSISKRLVELLGGTIGVTSWRGKGSTFFFEIPFVVASNEITPVVQNAVARAFPRFTGKRVLLAEDHLVNQIVACDFLEELNVHVTVANNGFEVLEMLQGQNYDLILMDCQMPEMDGFEATAAVRDLELDSGKRTPIIAVTANAMAGDRERCLSLGMDDYLSKPYDLEALSMVLGKWFQLQSKFANIIDADALFKRYKEKQARRLVETFIEDTELRLRKIGEALSTLDLAYIAREAHALKGASALLSMPEITATCSTLEDSCSKGDAELADDCLKRLTKLIHQADEEREKLFPEQ
ncbi:MAG TPA: ATP-binding protein [Drouetiella sp.]